MRCSTLLVASLVAATRVASAQPNTGQPPPPPIDSTTGAGTPTTAPDTTAPQPPANPPPMPPMVMHHHDEGDEGELAPNELAFGIGFGYQFKTNLETPNIVSAAIRLPTGLTFEPLLVVRNTSDTTQNQPASSMTTTTTELALGTLLRLPVIKRHRTEFQVLGNALLDTVKTHPDTPDSDTRSTTVGLGWGIGVAFWITRHWQITFDATNPILTYTSTTMQTGPQTEDKRSTSDFGLIFDPTVTAMIHLYN
jgi:hypothetical protein